nr:trafficking protein particle complex subunit 2-like protein [Quercus suber]
MLNSSLDIFEARMPAKTVGHDFGLLHALDERIALYGWLTNTSVKFVIVVDMEGRTAPTLEAGRTVGLGLRGGDLVGAFQALQTAYIRLLRNPFYVPDDHDPKLGKNTGRSLHITSDSASNSPCGGEGRSNDEYRTTPSTDRQPAAYPDPSWTCPVSECLVHSDSNNAMLRRSPPRTCSSQ